MLAFAVLLFVLGLGSIVLGCLDQRRLYWALEAWSHRHPEAREPSDQAYGLRRMSYLLLGMVSIMFGALLVSMYDPSASEEEVRSAGEGEQPVCLTVRAGDFSNDIARTDVRVGTC